MKGQTPSCLRTEVSCVVLQHSYVSERNSQMYDDGFSVFYQGVYER